MKVCLVLSLFVVLVHSYAGPGPTLVKPSALLSQTNSPFLDNPGWFTNGIGASESTPVDTTRSGPLLDEEFAARIQRDARKTPFEFTFPKPNEISLGRFTYSGILVELLKVPHPLQILNPLAPTEYGSGELNLVRDPTQSRPVGLKLFAIQF